jgi:hypothetical protein
MDNFYLAIMGCMTLRLCRTIKNFHLPKMFCSIPIYSMPAVQLLGMSQVSMPHELFYVTQNYLIYVYEYLKDEIISKRKII